MEVLKGCYGKSAGGVELIWAGLELTIIWWIRDIKLKTLAGLGVILWGISISLISTDVNDYFFWMSMLIFGSIDGVSCWGIEESNLDSRSTHAFEIGYIFLYLQRLFLSQIRSYSSITRLANHWFI